MAGYQEKSMANNQTTGVARGPLEFPCIGAQPELRTRPRALAIAVGAALLPAAWSLSAFAGPLDANTLPTNVVVTTGGTVGTLGTNMNITTFTGSSIVTANTFNIGKNSSVFVDQPTSASTSLIKVSGGGQSVWDGRFGSDGRIFFTNADGLLISRGATVDVGSLFATSLSINNADFLAGRYQF